MNSNNKYVSKLEGNKPLNLNFSVAESQTGCAKDLIHYLIKVLLLLITFTFLVWNLIYDIFHLW